MTIATSADKTATTMANYAVTITTTIVTYAVTDVSVQYSLKPYMSCRRHCYNCFQETDTTLLLHMTKHFTTAQ